MTGLPWAPMLLVAGAYLAMFAAGELIHRIWRAAPELTRKLDHAGAGGIALVLPALFDTPWPVIVLAVPFLAFLGATMLGGWLGSVHGIARRSVGSFLYPVAIAAAFWLAHDNVARYAIAVLSLALADSAAWLAGQRWGRHRYLAWGELKTWEGSLATLATTTLLASAGLAISGTPFLEACLVGLFTGLVVAMVEGALPWGIDNLGIPLAALAALGAAGSPWAGGLVALSSAGLLGLALWAPGVGDRSINGAVTNDAR